MSTRRSWWLGPALAIALSGLMGQTNSLRAAGLSQYLSPDFCAVLVIQPERIGQSTLAEAIKSALPASVMKADPAAAVAALKAQKGNVPPGMDAEKLVQLFQGKSVQRLALFFDAAMEKNIPGIALVAQFSSDIDGEAILSAITTEWQTADANGAKYRKLKGKPGQPDGAAVAPDGRTLIFGVESAVLKMLAGQQGERPLLKQLQRASFDNDIVFELYADALWAGVAKTAGKSIDETIALAVKDPSMAALAKDVKSLSVRINFSGKKLLRGEVATGKPETAATLSTLGQQMKDSAKQEYEDMKKKPPQGPAAMVLPMLSKVGDEAFQGLEIKADGTLMSVDLAMPDSLASTLKSLVQMFGAMIPGPPVNAPPVKK
jgi:hypothetical protein